MFCYQPNFFSQTEVMTSERFTQLIISDAVISRIKAYRAKLPELDRLKALIKDRELLIEANPDPKLSMNADLKAEIKKLQAQCRLITSIKTGLPIIIYQATFDESKSSKGYSGRWRKQTAARLNGLFILDIDHIADPMEEVMRWVKNAEEKKLAEYSRYGTDKEKLKRFCDDSGIFLIHITPSGKGLRLVCKAEAAIGNIADNQQWMAENVLGVENDEACKDASRCSFCPGFEDIIYVNTDQLFSYENKDYDEKYGPQYRGGSSQPTGKRSGDDTNQHQDARRRDDIDEQLEKGYHGKSYTEICKQWFVTVQGGLPKAGDRHQSLYRLACDLRYITDFNPSLLARILEECEVGRDIREERGADEIKRIANDACSQQRYRTIPQKLQKVLQDSGIQLDGGNDEQGSTQVSEIDYGIWWNRLRPFLSEGDYLYEAVAQLPEQYKLAGVLAAGAMYGTYLTRCWWEHFDGKDYRLSFLVYIIGGAASGKSFVPHMDSLIMAPMLAADKIGREWERQYKEEMKKRSASTKNAKAEAPELQHPVIRYIPSTISNAMLYRRLTDAIDNNCIGSDGNPIHLHCYTCEAELATALRAQQGSWAGKLDLECKSFQNEVAGVDYANDQSVNGIIQVNWNQVITGTPDALGRKIKPSTVLDGLVTRLVLFPMPSNNFAMIEKRRAVRNHAYESKLRSAGVWLEEVKGEIKADKMVDFCYEYEKKLAEEAKLEQDLCLDYFRKRIPLIMMRYGLVRLVLKQKDKAIKGEPLDVTDNDLEFCRLIGDFCLMTQMHTFGQQVMEALEKEQKSFIPRKRSFKMREAYSSLPEVVTTEVLVANHIASNMKTASNTLQRWLNDGLVSRIDNKTYRKTYKEIPE